MPFYAIIFLLCVLFLVAETIYAFASAIWVTCVIAAANVVVIGVSTEHPAVTPFMCKAAMVWVMLSVVWQILLVRKWDPPLLPAPPSMSFREFWQNHRTNLRRIFLSLSLSIAWNWPLPLIVAIGAIVYSRL